MKKIAVFLGICILAANSVIYTSAAAERNLIENIQIYFKSAETPNRLEVMFDLTAPIDLSQGDSDIIYEYFTGDSDEAIYRKDRTWAGYINGYENYPAGERKYSSGDAGQDFPNKVPAAAIYTSVRTGGSIDVALVTAVRVTVLKPDGSGEMITVFRDQTTSPVVKISVPLVNVEVNTGIRLDSTTDTLPPDVELIAAEVTEGPRYEEVSEILPEARGILVFEIKLEAKGVKTQPDGAVKISIPLPPDFEQSHVAAYRIGSEGNKTRFPVTKTTENNVQYATFETDHFSVFVLARLEEYTYPYTVAYYRGSVSPGNVTGTAPGAAMFPEKYRLTAADVAADLGTAWLNAQKPASGYADGAIYGGFPAISSVASDNTVHVLYSLTPAFDGGGTAADAADEPAKAPAFETPVPETIQQDEPGIPVFVKGTHERYIRGYGNNTVKPDENVTRAEMAMVLFNLSAEPHNETDGTQRVLNDVDPNAWYAEAIAYLYNKGVIRGYGDQTYRPDVFITHAEMALLISRFGNFIYESDAVHPDHYATRAEMIAIVNQTQNRRVRREELPAGINQWSDVPAGHWAYADIMEATLSHTYERETIHDFETWLSIHEFSYSNDLI